MKKPTYFEKLRMLKELKRLRAEEKKFKRAAECELNTSSMDEFCLAGLKKIQGRIHEIISII